jgi:hypothetical protein
MAAYWAALRVKTNCESKVELCLKALGLSAYCPRSRRERIGRRGKRVTSIRPMFPNYLFILVTGQWRPALSIPSVSNAIKFGDAAPSAVPDAVIQEIRKREAEEAHKSVSRALTAGSIVKNQGRPPRRSARALHKRARYDGRGVAQYVWDRAHDPVQPVRGQGGVMSDRDPKGLINLLVASRLELPEPRGVSRPGRDSAGHYTAGHYTAGDGRRRIERDGPRWLDVARMNRPLIFFASWSEHDVASQSAWMREAGVSRSAIGLMSYAALAFTFKFAWAPFIDEYDAPLVSARLGRRRGWMLIAQLGVAAGLLGLAFGAPADSAGASPSPS